MNLSPSTFVKNIAVLFSGNFMFQIITVLSLIFISRFYSPSVVGEYAVFLSINAIVSNFATGRLEMAIMLPKQNKEAYHIFISSILIMVFISIITLIICLSLYFNGLLQNKSYFVYILPISILMSSFSLLQIQYLNRVEKFKIISKGKVLSSVFTAIIQVLSVFVFKDIIILILAYPLGLMMSDLYYFVSLKKYFEGFPVSIDKIKETISFYKKFPLLNNISSLFNLIANQGPVILIEVVYGSAISGFYSIVQKTLNAPASLISMAFSQVFYKRITTENSNEKIKGIMKSSLKYFSFISIIILAIVLVLGEFLYTFVFGDEYIISAVMAKIMVVFFLVRLIFSSQSILVIAKSKLAFDLKFNIVYAISQLTPIAFGYYFNLDWSYTIAIISILGSICFLYLGYYLFKKVLI